MRRSIQSIPLVTLLLLSPLMRGQSPVVEQRGLTEMPIKVVTAPRPQTDADVEAGKKLGRTLPEIEVLRPSLDSELVDFTPKLGKDLRGSMTGASSDVTVLLIHRWIDAFRKYYPNMRITVDPPYAGSLGAKELVAGKLDFVIVSRELKPDDITDFQSKFGYGPLSVPISGGSYRHYGFLDAVVFFVNKDNPIDQLTFRQLDELYSKTHHRGGAAVTTWGDLGATGEWAKHPVHLYGIKPWNGFEEFVRQRVLSVPGKRGEWRADINYDKLVFPIAGRVAADPDGIGYAGLAFVDHSVKILALSADGGEAISPNYSDVAMAAYPLSRVIYFNANKKPAEPLNPAMAEFMRFILSKQGQEVVRAEGIFLPLREFQVKSSLEQMSK